MDHVNGSPIPLLFRFLNGEPSRVHVELGIDINTTIVYLSLSTSNHN